MAYRVFASPDGTIWQAWDVPAHGGPPPLAEGAKPEDFRDGWLCFESEGEKRRLAPVPSRWSERSEAQLWLYCRVAEPVRSHLHARSTTGEEARAHGEAPLAAPRLQGPGLTPIQD